MNTNVETELKIVVKDGFELVANEFSQIKEALFREFKYALPSREEFGDRLFFLLKNGDEILSMGALKQVKPVFFSGEEFSLFGFVNVVSNQKGKGYGKQVVTAMRDYLISHKMTGIGFTMPKNRGFYEKCGFTFTTNSTQRFVYKKSDQEIRNQDGQIIFYQDSLDRFMEKVLSDPDKEVFLPAANLW